MKCPLLIKEKGKLTCDEIGNSAIIETCLKTTKKDWINCTSYLVQNMKTACISGHEKTIL